MKPWKMATILAAGWFVLMIIVGIVHTEVVIRDLSPEQDEALSFRYGQAAALGALVLAIVGYQYQKRTSRARFQ